ncbi:phage tail tape measure protein [Metabacillus fastidiosus]|uniref:phage tail tape measure protein n=1 Tax=Metabacillus fastidiosus TaxID=1458 RepID=UPI003D2BE5D1
MSNELKILIQGQLDISSTTKVINEQLRAIGNKTKISIGVDLKDIQKINDQIKQLQSKSSSKSISIVDSNSSKQMNTLINSSNKLSSSQNSLRDSTRQSSDSLRDASSNMISFSNAMKQALVKYPIWMASTTLFIGSFKALSSVTQVIVDVDTRITNLKKVMDQDTNFDKIMANAVSSAEKFAKSLNGVLDSYGEFARQGFKEDDLINLGEAGLIASNVGEIGAGRAAEYLTAAIIQWKKESKDAMGVIDSWNNVSNKYATTVEKLAQGQARAASTAKAMGMDMHQLNAMIGTVTAATKQSGNEVGNFVKFVLPRLTSKPAKAALDSLNISLTDDAGDIRDAMDIYEQVAQSYSNLNKMQQTDVAEGLAGKHHIARMQAFLENISMYKDILNDSINSEHSALRENETYMESLAARTELAKVEFEKMALAIGDAFLTEGYIEVIRTLGELASIATKVAKEVGVLPIVLGTISTSLLMLSSRFRTAAASGTLFSASLAGVGGMAKGVSVSLRALGMASGIGLIFTGVGFAIEKLMNHMGEVRERTEALQKRNEDLITTYKDNKDTISSLIPEYEKYEKLINSGNYNLDDLKQYNTIKHQIAELMPSLVIDEDAYGNKIIGSSEYIKAKTASLEKQLEIQERLAAIENENELNDNYDAAKKNLEGLQKSLSGVLDGKGVAYNYIKDMEDIEAAFDKLQNKITKGEKLNPTEQDNYDYFKYKLEEYNSLSNELEKAKIVYQNAASEIINATATIDGSLNQSSKEIISSFTAFVGVSEESGDKINKVFSQLKDDMKSDPELSKSLREYGKVVEQFQRDIENGVNEDKLTSSIENVKRAFGGVKNELIDYAESNEFSEKSVNELSAQLDTSLQSIIKQEEFINKLSKSTGKNREEIMSELAAAGALEDGMDELSDSIDGTASSHEDFAKKLKNAKGEYASLASIFYESISGISSLTSEMTALNEELKDGDNTAEKRLDRLNEKTSLQAQIAQTTTQAIEALSASYYSLADEVAPLNGLLEDLAEGKSISAAEAMKLIEKEGELADAISIENGVISVNEDAVLKLRDSKIKSYSDMSQAINAELANTKNATLQKLKFYGIELQGVKSVAEARQKANEQYAQQFKGMEGESWYTAGMSSVQTDINTALAPIIDAENQIAKLSELASTGLTQVGTSAEDLSKSTDKAKDSTEEFTETTKTYTYVADKYKIALEKINNQLTKTNNLKNKYATHSSNYRKAIQKEIDLLLDQKKAYQEQYADIQNQINTGKFITPGIQVDETTKTTTYTNGSATGSYASGNSTKDQIWNFFKNKGFSDSAIAGIMGNLQQESQFSTTIVNPKSGATGLGQWLGSRLTDLKKYAKEIGRAWSDLDVQLEFLWKELNGRDSTTKSILNKNGGLDKLKNASLEVAVSLFEKAFERSGGSAMSARNKYANQIYGTYAGKGIQQLPNTTSSSPTMMSGGSSVGQYYLDNYEISTKFNAVDSTHSKPHKGIDLNKKGNADLGDPVKSLKSGKVITATYSKTAGYYVVVQQDDGFVASYMHLMKQPKVAVGNRVEEGQELGQIGNTGRSYGAHLDLKIKDSKGNYIDPLPYLKNMTSSGVTGTSSSRDKNTTIEIGKYESELAQAIDNAKSQLLTIDGDISNLEDAIAQKITEIINSKFASYDRSSETIQNDILKNQNAKDATDPNTKKYRSIINNQMLLTEKEIRLKQREIGMWTDEIKKNTDLNEAQRDLIQQRIIELGKNIDSLKQVNSDYAMELIENRFMRTEKYRAENTNANQKYLDYEANSVFGTKDVDKALRNQLILQDRNKKSLQDEMKYINTQIKTNKYLTEASKNDLRDRYQELANELREVDSVIGDIKEKALDNNLEKFASKFDDLDSFLNTSKETMNSYNDTSKEYGFEIEKQIGLLNEKKKVTEDEIRYLNQALKRDDLSKRKKAELAEQLEDVTANYHALNNEIRETNNQQIQFVFRVQDKSIDEAQQKIDFISFKMSLLSDDVGFDIKAGLFTEMNTELSKVNTELETAIQNTIRLRTEAGAKNQDTSIYDERISELIKQRRSNIQAMKSNYDSMLSNVESAKTKVKDAETEALEQASKDFEKMLSESADRINTFQKMIDKAVNKLELVESTEFIERQSLIGESLLANKNKAAQIIEEFNHLRDVVVYSDKDASALKSQLEQLQNDLISTNKQTIEYVKTLEQVNFESLISGANLADKEIERLTSRLRSNMELLDGGLLSGTSLDFSFNIPQGSSLNLSSLISDPISDVKITESTVQDIKTSSYGEQIKMAEDLYSKLKEEAEKYRKEMLDAEIKYENELKSLIARSDESIAKSKEENRKMEEAKRNSFNNKELVAVQNHILDLERQMETAMKNYNSTYSKQWDSVLATLESKLKTAKAMEESILNQGKVDERGKLNGNNNTAKTAVSGGLKGIANKISGYADGTKPSGHSGGLAQVNEKGKELVILPDGTLGLTSNSNAHNPLFMNLPEGTHVIPNKETNEILNNIPAYASGTWDWDRLMTDDAYWLEYLKGTDPKAANSMLDKQNGYNDDNYYRDNNNNLINKQDGSVVAPSYNNYIPPSYYEPERNVTQYAPVYETPSYSNPYTYTPPVKTTDELASEKLRDLRSTNALVYSNKFISKYDPYNKNGSLYESSRKGKLSSITSLQRQLDNIENSNKTAEIENLTKQILDEQAKVGKEDMAFLIESLTDLSEQREKNARDLKAELIRELETTPMSEEIRNQYKEEIMRQDDIIAQSMSERKNLVKELFDYEQVLRDKRLHMIKENEQDIQRIIAETKLINPNDPKLLELTNKLLQEQAKYSGEIQKIRDDLINQMKAYEVGSYEWNLLNTQLTQNEINYQKDRLSQLDKINEEEERNLALKEKRDELEKVKNDKRFSYITSEGEEILTYDKGKVADLEKEIAKMEKEYKKNDIKSEYEKELALLEQRLSSGIQIAPEKLNESREYLDSLVEMYKKLATEDIETKHDGGIVGDKPKGKLSELVNSLFNVKPNEQIVKALKGELMIPSVNLPNLMTNIGNTIKSIVPKNNEAVAGIEHHYHFNGITVKANNMDEFIGSLEHFNRTK